MAGTNHPEFQLQGYLDALVVLHDSLINMRLLLGLATALVATSAPAATVSGTVSLRSGESRRPLAGVRVTARADHGSELLESAETDAQGRYLLRELPKSRIVLSAARAGYVGRAVASREARLILDLASDPSIREADFEMLPGGVITGRITDALGEPLERVQMELFRITHFGGRHRAQLGSATTDDRGVYRIFGLEPGRYILLARPGYRLGVQRAVALYYPGRSEESRAEEIPVAAGAEVTGIDMTLGAEPGYRISGKVAEVEGEPLSRIHVRAAAADRNLSGAESGFSTVDSEGTFALPSLPAGSYVLTVTGRNKVFTRQRIDLRANLSNVVLRPGRPGLLSGRLTFGSPSAARRLPERFRLSVTDKTDLHTVEAVAQAPDYRFEFPDLWPGAHMMELASPAGAYLKKLTVAAKSSERFEVMVTEGGATTVELEVGFGFGRISGMAKAPGAKTPLPHARIALARASAPPIEFRTAQADQRGRWSLPGVVPGEYRICAWPTVEVDALYAAETWDRAGAAVKSFAVEPGSEIEVELTAAAPEREARREKTP